MNEDQKTTESPVPAEEAAVTPQPVNEKFRELAELEDQIRRRLRSNQRFLEKFLDEDFIDDEAGEEDGETDDEEEL